MIPDWPNLPNYREFSDADHAAHRTGKGTLSWEDLQPGTKSTKFAKQLMKVASKPKLKFSRRTLKPKTKRKKP